MSLLKSIRGENGGQSTFHIPFVQSGQKNDNPRREQPETQEVTAADVVKSEYPGLGLLVDKGITGESAVKNLLAQAADGADYKASLVQAYIEARVSVHGPQAQAKDDDELKAQREQFGTMSCDWLKQETALLQGRKKAMFQQESQTVVENPSSVFGVQVTNPSDVTEQFRDSVPDQDGKLKELDEEVGATVNRFLGKKG